MRGDAGLGHLIHLAGADLHLHPLAVAARNCRVYRAVAVGLGLADIVLEPPGYGAPALMNGTQHAVAVGLGAGDDAKSVDVGQARKGLVLFLQLAPDGMGFLRAAEDVGLYVGLLEFEPDVGGNLLNNVARLALERDEATNDRVPRLGIQDAEGEILQLLAHPLHPHPAGKGREDVHRLTCLLDLLFGAHRLDRAHVVQPVGELDEDHPQILRHRHEELAKVLGLLRFKRGELKVRELSYPVHEFRDLGPEGLANLTIGGSCVLDRVVQERGDDRRVVELHLGQDGCDGDRVREVGLARVAELAFVHALSVGVGPAEERFVRFRVIVADQCDQVVGVDVHPARPRGSSPYCRSCASMSARRSFSSDMSSSTGRS